MQLLYLLTFMRKCYLRYFPTVHTFAKAYALYIIVYTSLPRRNERTGDPLIIPCLRFQIQPVQMNTVAVQCEECTCSPERSSISSCSESSSSCSTCSSSEMHQQPPKRGTLSLSARRWVERETIHEEDGEYDEESELTDTDGVKKRPHHSAAAAAATSSLSSIDLFINKK